MKKNDQLIRYLVLSFSALILISIIGLIIQTKQATFYDRLIVSLIFILSLLFGISISIRPGWYKPKKNIDYENNIKENSIDYKGHHPNCKGFSDHTITIKNKIYCAGCFGLLVGSLINIILIILFLVFDIIIIDYFLFLLIGIFLVTALFLIILFTNRKPFTRVLTNAIFMLSFFFIIISTLEITGSFIFGLLAGLLCFLFIDTRIKISKWTHVKICSNCEKNCKRY